LLADSNLTQSELLGRALRRESGFRVTCCGSGLADCLHALEVSAVDVILLGSGLANNGLYSDFGSLNALYERYPRTSLILLLDSYDRDLVVNALRAGVQGLFCRASQPFKALCRCIHTVQQGQIWINNEQLIYVVGALRHGPALHVTNTRGESLLTPREEQVVAQVAAGLPNRSIARHLSVAESTVKKSLLRIFDKLGVSNRVELVLYALSRREMKTQDPAIETPSISVPASRPPKAASANVYERRSAPTTGDARPLD
jgi:DNA-binding NarL/FixJ family response regulator